MNYSLKSLIILISILLIACNQKPAETQTAEYGIVIHGGAGWITEGKLSKEEENSYKAKMEEALRRGSQILSEGGSSLDAVEETIMILEDSPLFNAGKGAVFASSGENELDASIMEGKNFNAGAVAGVKHIKNPITLARAVMEKSPHVLLAQEGAEAFAVEQGFELVDNKYFFTQGRWDDLQNAKKSEQSGNDQSSLINEKEFKFGTVGCAALDKDGNLAAGTSTGGMTNKKFGRIGDSPIIGAGTYANNATCAISATGHGEYFIRNVVTHDISALMEYKGMSLNDATELVVNKKLKEQGGNGGIISIDKFGNVVMKFNTPGMFRGFMLENNEPEIKMYKN